MMNEQDATHEMVTLQEYINWLEKQITWFDSEYGPPAGHRLWERRWGYANCYVELMDRFENELTFNLTRRD